jgi:nicotinamide-nucleotide amidase
MDRIDDSCVQRALVERAQPIVDQLRRRGLWVITAESCTAGLIAAILSHARGAGECLHGGFVTYSKAHKSASLGVDPILLRTAGSVNAEVARQMAEGALRHSGASVSVSVSGVLGPDPDEDGAPPGLVFVAAARTGFETVVIERRFYCETPDEVRQCAIVEALKALLNVVRRDLDPAADRGGSALRVGA